MTTTKINLAVIGNTAYERVFATDNTHQCRECAFLGNNCVSGFLCDLLTTVESASGLNCCDDGFIYVEYCEADAV